MRIGMIEGKSYGSFDDGCRVRRKPSATERRVRCGEDGTLARREAGGAPNVPDAKLHLQLSQEDLQKSKDLIDKDNKRAASLIAVARAEAQLALSLAKASMAADQARQAQQDLQKAKGN